MRSPLGLQRGIVKLEPYNPEWAKLFNLEREALQRVLDDKFITAEHIGSTAIPIKLRLIMIKKKTSLDLRAKLLKYKILLDWAVSSIGRARHLQ